MNETLATNHYMVIDNFISEDRAKDMYQEFRKLYSIYPEEFIPDEICPTTPALYDGWIFLELMLEKLPFLNDIVEEPLFPTYCFGRLYKNGDDLRRHKDREACEVSVTLHLGSDGVEWPICFEKPNKETVCVNLKPGQAVIYLGCATEHWRDKFAGRAYGQVFLHYVRARGGYRRYYFDKRK